MTSASQKEVLCYNLASLYMIDHKLLRKPLYGNQYVEKDLYINLIVSPNRDIYKLYKLNELDR